MNQITRIKCLRNRRKKEGVIILRNEKIRAQRLGRREKKSEKYTPCQDEIHRYSCDQHETFRPPSFCRKSIHIMCLITRGVFSFDSNESADWKPVPRILSSFFILKEFFHLWRNSNTKFQYLHPRQSSGKKMPQFMNKYHKSKYSQC